MGIRQFVIAVSKMDDRTVNFSKERFEEMKTEMSQLISKKLSNPIDPIRCVEFVPISAYHGDNLVLNIDILKNTF